MRNMEKYDVIIVGAGPAGIFTAPEPYRRGCSKGILMVEKGKSAEKRSCPKAKTKKCVGCQPCNITTGFASPETLLYAPELKFYSNKVKMTPDLKTNMENLYCLGDAFGRTRGLMMASAMGVHMGRQLAGKE